MDSTPTAQSPPVNNVDNQTKHWLVAMIFSLVALIVFGLIWAFFLGSSKPEGLGWYLFSYSMGLTMIVLPCTFPLAFVIVPLSLGKGPLKGLLIALSFGLGVTITLSMYGILAAVLGKVFIGILGTSGEVLKNWLYFTAGAIAYIFALGELGLVKFRMPSYSGAAPKVIQEKKDYLKALLLGLFLGNIGVGCPHPATPLIFLEIARSGNIFYGWTLFLVHVIGRVLPLLLLVILGLVGVNGLSWLITKREKIEKGTGWLMLFVAGFILVLGLFTHDWWVNSGQHTLLESITQEESLLDFVSEKLGAEKAHSHGLEEGRGLFGLPLSLGNWILVLLWLIPLWWVFFKEHFKVKVNVEVDKH